MSPEQLTGWIQLVQLGIGVGIDLTSKLKAVLHAQQQDLTDEQLHEAYVAIMNDDAVRAAIAARDAGESVPPAATITTTTGANG